MSTVLKVCITIMIAAALMMPQISAGYEEGPDGYGYYYSDSNEEDGPTYFFTDIGISSYAFKITGDEMYGPVDIGFNFYFYGTRYTQVYISSNGFITFDRGWGSGCCSGGRLPEAGSIDATIAALWDDLNPSG